MTDLILFDFVSAPSESETRICKNMQNMLLTVLSSFSLGCDGVKEAVRKGEEGKAEN